jgi:hypothetical protein
MTEFHGPVDMAFLKTLVKDVHLALAEFDFLLNIDEDEFVSLKDRYEVLDFLNAQQDVP